MRKRFLVALVVTGSLVVGPTALATAAEPSGTLPGYDTPQHSGHNHGKKHGKSKKSWKKSWKKDDHHGHGHGKGQHEYLLPRDVQQQHEGPRSRRRR